MNKSFELHKQPVKDKTEISIQKKQEVEKFIFTGKLVIKPNQRLFKIDLDSGEVLEVEFYDACDTINYIDVINKKPRPSSRDVIIEEGYDYVVKLNLDNAISFFKDKWSNIDVSSSIDHKGNTLNPNQRFINKFKNRL